ncbi:hypothetical protein EDEG_00052 [Edhazardia aedis USNM 41457]|uniref:OTU domain-containing protein n=1 Tax=Edhazardia aedis (strain USNM 41457) TaxID=1003232 RepID=J9A0E3_EDHAE|nr:hypothetical protein EDEG_00052 [Edhazardia aedis USNM 41457]|eukprot:EJW05388.1 hypothetical protein EDEG_00052 [Edhazardia aedis USNM 41457]
MTLVEPKIFPLCIHPAFDNEESKVIINSIPYKNFAYASRDGNCFYTSYLAGFFSLLPFISKEKTIKIKNSLQKQLGVLSNFFVDDMVYGDFYCTFKEMVSKFSDNPENIIKTLKYENVIKNSNNNKVKSSKNQITLINSDYKQFAEISESFDPNDIVSAYNDYKNNSFDNEDLSLKILQDPSNSKNCIINDENIVRKNSKYEDNIENQCIIRQTLYCEINKYLMDYFKELIALLRIFVSTHLRYNKEKYQPFIEIDIDDYCKKNVDPFYKDAGNLEISCLADILGIGIKIFYSDRSDFMADFGEGEVFIPILYVPGHFDPLYD